jgi:hypothetical protein
VVSKQLFAFFKALQPIVTNHVVFKIISDVRCNVYEKIQDISFLEEIICLQEVCCLVFHSSVCFRKNKRESVRERVCVYVYVCVRERE